MRGSPLLRALVIASAVLACTESPGKPTAPTGVGAPSFNADGSSTEVQSRQRDVFMQTLGNDACLNVTGDGQDAMIQTVSLPDASNLFLIFTFEWGSLAPDEEGLLSPVLDGAGSPFEWGFVGNPISRTSGTVTWSFANVPQGTHTVAIGARVEGADLSAELNDCALTVFVVR